MSGSILLMANLAFAFHVSQSQQQAQPTSVAFTHVTVIDATGSPAKADMTVVISGNRITAIGKTGSVSIPEGARVVAANGKFLIPGLWDMHTHASWQLRDLYLANGITGFREMGAAYSLERLATIRQSIADGSTLAPRLVAGSKMVDGPSPARPPFAIAVANESDARRAVDSLERAGVDFVKVYSLLSRESYFAVVEQAKKRGLPIAGHVPDALRVAEASNAGQRSIEHPHKLRLAVSSLEEQTVAERIANPIDGTARLQTDFLRLKRIVESYDESRATELFKLLVRNGTWVTPTLVNVQSRSAHAGDDDYRKDPRFRYMPAAAAETFWKSGEETLTPDQLEILELNFQGFLRMVGAMHRAGVKILAGSDAPAGRFNFPGFSLHGELELLVTAGLTPMEALQTATLNPARFLALEKDLGTIEAGKFADLVLLNANPLTNIRNTQRIEAVVLDGRLLDRAALDGLLARAEAAAKR